jgi:ABC-type multidrug transport system fused ATPase/permease subunit
MLKTLTSFFRFYYYMIKGSPKRYDIAMDVTQGTATAMTPLIGFLGFVFFSMIFLNPLYGATFPLAIPFILGNMFIVHKVRDEGYEIQRKLREEQREAERQERQKQMEEERRKRQEEWDRINREMDELLERMRRARMERERQRQQSYRQRQESHSERHNRQQQNIQNQNMINAMKLLGLNKGFTEKDVKKAYRRLSKIHHPDAGGLQANFIKLNKAYNFIMERI